MCGSTVNGNIRETINTGGRDPGKSPEKATPGNQDIGKTAKKVTNGIRAAGRGRSKYPGNRKAPLWARLFQ